MKNQIVDSYGIFHLNETHMQPGLFTDHEKTLLFPTEDANGDDVYPVMLLSIGLRNTE